MCDRHVYECLDRSLRSVLGNNEAFGGIPCIFNGDWQQLLPVVVRGADWQVIDRCLKSSPTLWHHFKTMTLTINMRIRNRIAAGASERETEKAQMWQEYLTMVGQGTIANHPERGDDIIKIADECISEAQSMEGFIEEIYPSLASHLGDMDYFSHRCIVSTKNALVDEINNAARPIDKMQSLLSADRVGDEDDEEKFPEEVLNNFTPSGMPPHKLYMEEGTPLLLLRNLDPAHGACNGTCMIVRKMHSRLLGCEIMTGKNTGNHILIPRMNLSSKKGAYAFQLHRRQFPVRVAYAMTINKSQGQSIAKVGIWLPLKVWTHGQLYVALSRAGAAGDVKLYIRECGDKRHCMRTREGTFTKNVVFDEIIKP